MNFKLLVITQKFVIFNTKLYYIFFEKLIDIYQESCFFYKAYQALNLKNY